MQAFLPMIFEHIVTWSNVMWELCNQTNQTIVCPIASFKEKNPPQSQELLLAIYMKVRHAHEKEKYSLSCLLGPLMHNENNVSHIQFILLKTADWQKKSKLFFCNGMPLNLYWNLSHGNCHWYSLKNAVLFLFFFQEPEQCLAFPSIS